MATVNITKRWLEALKPPAKDTVWWDTELRGFGVRATSTGSVSFLVQYRNAQGRSRRMTIGPWGAYAPAAARQEAEEILREAHAARRGKATDPAERKFAERNAISFKALADEYMDKARAGLILGRKGRPKKPGTVAIDRYRVAHLVGYFGAKPVKDIDRAECQRCIEKLIAGRHGAARTYGLLGGILSYAIQQGYVASNPAHGIRKPADGQRDFRLDATGYRALGLALEAAEARAEPWQAVGSIRLLALTGCRKGEIRKLQLTEVDLQGRCLRLGDTKTGQSIRPLGEPVLRVLRSILNRPNRPTSKFVFPGRDPRKPFNGFGGATEGAWHRIVGGEYSAHGLRHAFASACDELGLSELTIATLLGHASAKSGSTTRGYIKKPDAVLLAAADSVSEYISNAMAGQSHGQVIELTTAADDRG
jgi:integrase